MALSFLLIALPTEIVVRAVCAVPMTAPVANVGVAVIAYLAHTVQCVFDDGLCPVLGGAINARADESLSMIDSVVCCM